MLKDQKYNTVTHTVTLLQTDQILSLYWQIIESVNQISVIYERIIQNWFENVIKKKPNPKKFCSLDITNILLHLDFSM